MKPEIVFIEWVISLKSRAKYRNDNTSLPERTFNHEGDPGELIWKIKAHEGEMALCLQDWRDDKIEVHASLVPRLWVGQDYDGKESQEDIAARLMESLRAQVAWADELLTDCPFPVWAAWRSKAGHSSWISTPAPYAIA